MDKEQRSHDHQPDSFAPLDGAPEETGGGAEMVDYMLGQPQSQVSFDKLSFSDVLQFADFGTKLALNQPVASADRDDIADDDGYFLRFQS